MRRRSSYKHVIRLEIKTDDGEGGCDTSQSATFVPLSFVAYTFEYVAWFECIESLRWRLF